MNASAFRWDFFVAHAGRDAAIAEQVYDRLISDARVFLDSRCLDLGDDWDIKLRDAQRASLVTLVLVSSNTDKAYYQREEIAAAIAMARTDGGHRVVPVYLDDKASESDSVPYGLRLKHGLTLSAEFCLNDLRIALLALHAKLGSNGGSDNTDEDVCCIQIDQSYQQDQWYGEPTLHAGYSSAQSLFLGPHEWSVHSDGYKSGDSLARANVLILPTPFRSYVDDSEYREIVRWVQHGGGVLLLGFYLMEAHHQNNMNQLLRRFGVEFRHDLLMPEGRESFQECMAQSFAYQDAALWIASELVGVPVAHPILEGVGKIALTSSCTVECAETPELLVHTREDVAALHVKGYKDPETGRIVRPTDYVLDRRGPGTFLSALQFGKGRVIAIGSWKMFLNEFMDHNEFDNAKLMANCINWLSKRKAQP